MAGIKSALSEFVQYIFDNVKTRTKGLISLAYAYVSLTSLNLISDD